MCIEDGVRRDVVSVLTQFQGSLVRAVSCVLPTEEGPGAVTTAEGFLERVGDDWQVVSFRGVATTLRVRGLVGRRGRLLVACLDDVERMRDAVGLACDLVVDASSSEKT